MKQRRINLSLYVACLALVACGAPTMSLRLRGLHTSTGEQWRRTYAAIAANPGCCDEVWFSTGIGVPPLEWHREQAARLVEAAAELKKLGIVPSLQVQATLGHADSLSASEDCSAKNWTGWTGSTGVEDRYCNCPRQKGFLAYVREMARIYASFRPGSVWVDDDLRIAHHKPASENSRLGCWCATCIAAFNVEEKSSWTRQTLDAAMAKDVQLAARWKAFQVRSIAAVARVISEAFAELSPETRMGYQFCFDDGSVDSAKAVAKTMYEATGHDVGMRPGGGYYYDIDPRLQIEKSILTARSRKTLGNPAYVGTWCPEVESWPRAYASRSAQSAIVESFSAIMWGMNSTSLLLLDTRYETDALYSRTILKPLADAAPVLKGYVLANEGTVPAGYSASAAGAGKLYRFALSGIPILPGVGKDLGKLTDRELNLDVCVNGSKTIQELRDALDARSGGVPAVVESPFVGMVLPRVTNDGCLRTVALLNTRIDVQEQVAVRLRGVPEKAKLVWRELRRPPVELPITRNGELVRVSIPQIGAWNGGFVDIVE